MCSEQVHPTKRHLWSRSEARKQGQAQVSLPEGNPGSRHLCEAMGAEREDWVQLSLHAGEARRDPHPRPRFPPSTQKSTCPAWRCTRTPCHAVPHSPPWLSSAGLLRSSHPSTCMPWPSPVLARRSRTMSLSGLILSGPVPPVHGCVSAGCRAGVSWDGVGMPGQLGGTGWLWSLQPPAWAAPRLQCHGQCHLTLTPLSTSSVSQDMLQPHAMETHQTRRLAQQGPQRLQRCGRHHRPTATALALPGTVWVWPQKDPCEEPHALPPAARAL